MTDNNDLQKLLENVSLVFSRSYFRAVWNFRAVLAFSSSFSRSFSRSLYFRAVLDFGHELFEQFFEEFGQVFEEFSFCIGEFSRSFSSSFGVWGEFLE